MNCPVDKPGLSLTYDHCKRMPHLVNVSLLLEYARNQSAAGTIDGLGNLSGTNVYLYRGTKDTCYRKGSVQHSQTFFESLGANVQFNSTTGSAHAWPTLNWSSDGTGPGGSDGYDGGKCGNGDVIENCDYDGPGAALQHIYDGKLKPPVDYKPELLRQFDQKPFWSQHDNFGNLTYNETMPHVAAFATAGYVYVPSACTAKGARCKLHFALHGCSVDEYYDSMVQHLGFQRWGEANGIVIVWPRISPHGGTQETHDGCWDGEAYRQLSSEQQSLSLSVCVSMAVCTTSDDCLR